MLPDRMMVGYLDKVSAVVKTNVDEGGEKRSQKFFDVSLVCADISYPEIKYISEDIYDAINPKDDIIKFRSIDYADLIPIFEKNCHLEIKIKPDENINLFDDQLEVMPDDVIEKFPMPILTGLHLTMVENVPQFQIKILIPNIKSGDFLFNNIKSSIEFQFVPIKVEEEEKSSRTRGKKR